VRKFCSASVVSAPLPGFRTTVVALFLLAVCSTATAALGQEPVAVASASNADPVVSTDAAVPLASSNVPVQPVAAVKVRFPGKYDVDRIGDRNIGKGINFFSLNRERAMGENMSRDLDAHLQLIRDPELNAYVNHVVQNLVIHSDAKVPFSVRIVKNDEVNAFSLPGGFLYVNTGLLAAAPDEATFAGILAHEVAHVAARHATKNLTRRMLFRVAYVPLMFVTGGAAVAIGNAAGVAIPIFSMKFNRNAEREADLLGIEYAYSAGYDPAAFVQFFETLQSRQKRKVPRFFGLMFTSHPMDNDRIKRAQAVITSLLPEKSDYVIDTSDFRMAKERLFQVVHKPCTDASGMPILVGAGQNCADKDAPKRPTLRGTLHPKPNGAFEVLPLPVR